MQEVGEGVKTTRKKVVKEKKMAGSVELKVGKAPTKTKKTTGNSSSKTLLKAVKRTASATKNERCKGIKK